MWYTWLLFYKNKRTRLFLKKAVIYALVKVTPSLIFKDSFLGEEQHIKRQKTVNNCFYSSYTMRLKTEEKSHQRW